MPNAIDEFTSYIVLTVAAGRSGSLGFGRARTAVQPAGGNFDAAFIYSIGDPPANAFSATITGAGATIASITPSVPRTQRPVMGGSPSEMGDIPPGEMQAGSVAGTVPVNTCLLYTSPSPRDS